MQCLAYKHITAKKKIPRTKKSILEPMKVKIYSYDSSTDHLRISLSGSPLSREEVIKRFKDFSISDIHMDKGIQEFVIDSNHKLYWCSTRLANSQINKLIELSATIEPDNALIVVV